MKALPHLALLLGLCLTLFSPPRAHAELEVTFDYFYEALAPYGDWVEVEGYGSCWVPTAVDKDWAPYTEGQWVYTDAGWTWLGDEPFAGIVYHYGRWIVAGNLGWCWVPGFEWGPAWVSWRDNDEYIGWAPLPPAAVWEPQQGLGVWVDEVYGIGPSYYSFCHHRDFGERHLGSVILARNWNTTILVQTVNITNITYNRESRSAFCGGPSYERACRFSSRPISALNLDRRNDFRTHDGHHHQALPGGSIVGNTLAVVAPKVISAANHRSTPPKPTKVIAQGQVSFGWHGKGASGDLASVRQKIRSQVEGLTPKTSPAKPIAAKELQVIPSKMGPATNPVVFPAEKARPIVGPSPVRTPGAVPYIHPTTSIPRTQPQAPQQFVPNGAQTPVAPVVVQPPVIIENTPPSRESQRQQVTQQPFNQPQQRQSIYGQGQQPQRNQTDVPTQSPQQAQIIQQGRNAMERRRQAEAQQQQVIVQQQQQFQQQRQAPTQTRVREVTPPTPAPRQVPANVFLPQQHVRPQPQVQIQVPMQQIRPQVQQQAPLQIQRNDDRGDHKKKK